MEAMCVFFDSSVFAQDLSCTLVTACFGTPILLSMDPLPRLVLFAISFCRLDRVFRFSVRFRVQQAGRSVFKLPLFG